MNNENYERTQLMITAFDEEDVITTSSITPVEYEDKLEP